jgi:membrane protease YdiL (CAAX protease family)
MLRRIFYNDAEKRLRAAWRLGLQTALLMAVAVPLYLAFRSLAGHPIWSPVLFLAKALAVILSIVVAARFLDRRRFADLGFKLDRRWWLDCGFGFFLGALLMAGIFLVERAAGWIEVTSTFHTTGPLPFGVSIFFMLVVFGLVGFYEEAYSRGYGLKNLAEGLNLPFLGPRRAVVAAWLISSVFFGVGHAVNPHASPVSTLGVTAAGLLLGLGYVLTGRLGISIGLHFSWNFFQGSVFGFPVSGRDFQVSFLGISPSGPGVWTGGGFGPEAGLLGFLACLLGCLLVLLWVRGVYGPLRILPDIAVYRRSNR